MNILLKAALLAAGMGIAATGHAAAYKCQDDKGKTVYSDIPCAGKQPPKVEPKAAPAKTAAPVSTAPLTRLAEADVLRFLTVTQDLSRTNSQAELCALYAADMKFRMEFKGDKPKTISGGREEACKSVRDSAEAAKRAGLVGQSERGATKVSIEPGETRATATYEILHRVTRYDRIISTLHCTSKDQFVLMDGKILITSSDDVCKP